LEDNFKNIAQQNPKVLEQLEEVLKLKQEKYENRRHRKYYCLAFGVIVGIGLGYLLPWAINKVTHALYQRDQLEQIMEDYLGDADFE